MNYILKQFDEPLVKFSATTDTSEPEIQILWTNEDQAALLPLDLRLSKKPVIARRPNGPTWQSVPKTHEYQHIPDFLVTDSHVAALLGMTETGLSTR